MITVNSICSVLGMMHKAWEIIVIERDRVLPEARLEGMLGTYSSKTYVHVSGYQFHFPNVFAR